MGKKTVLVMSLVSLILMVLAVIIKKINDDYLNK